MKELRDTFRIIIVQIKKWYKEDFAKAFVVTLAAAGFYLICMLAFPSLAFRASSGVGIILTGAHLVLIYRCIYNSTEILEESKRNVETKQAITILTIYQAILFIFLAVIRLIQATTFPETGNIAFSSILATGITAFLGMILLTLGTRYILCWILCCLWLILDNTLGSLISYGSTPARTLVGYAVEKISFIVNNGIISLLCGLCLVILGGIISGLILNKIYVKKEQLLFANMLGKIKR